MTVAAERPRRLSTDLSPQVMSQALEIVYSTAWGFDEASIQVSSCLHGCSLFFHSAEIAVSLYFACLIFQPLPCRSLV
jgi:hypothetical protein